MQFNSVIFLFVEIQDYVLMFQFTSSIRLFVLACSLVETSICVCVHIVSVGVCLGVCVGVHRCVFLCRCV